MHPWTATHQLVLEALRQAPEGRLDLGGLQRASGLRPLALVRAIEDLERDEAMVRSATEPVSWSLGAAAGALDPLQAR